MSRTPYAVRIMEALRLGPQTAAQLAEALGCTRNWARQCCLKLAKRGLVVVRQLRAAERLLSAQGELRRTRGRKQR